MCTQSTSQPPLGGGIGPTLKVWLYIFCFHVFFFFINVKFHSEVSTKLVLQSTYNIELELLSYFYLMFDIVACLATLRAFFSRFLIFCLTFICNYQPACRSSFTYKNRKIFACGGPWYNLFLILFRWKVIVQYRVNCFH